MTARVRDLAALMAFLEARAAMPFAWGNRANDCVSFAASAVKAQTGRNPITGLRWASLRGAVKAVEKVGGIEAALDARFDRIAPAMAQRGDIAAVAAEDGPFPIRLMIVEGETLVGPSDRGLRRMPRAAMCAAWSIG